MTIQEEIVILAKEVDRETERVAASVQEKKGEDETRIKAEVYCSRGGIRHRTAPSADILLNGEGRIF